MPYRSHRAYFIKECSVRQELPHLSTTGQNKIQTDFYNFSQYNCRQIISTTRRDVDMRCLWTSWNSDTSYMTTNFRTRRRSCMAFC